MFDSDCVSLPLLQGYLLNVLDCLLPCRSLHGSAEKSQAYIASQLALEYKPTRYLTLITASQLLCIGRLMTEDRRWQLNLPLRALLLCTDGPQLW